MVRCNLSVLLAEQNLKITKVSNDTGISRTTLTALCNNYSQGIQFDTLNTLCMYLNVSSEQLISHVPVDLKITSVFLDPSSTDEDWLWEIDLELIKYSQTICFDLCGCAFPTFDDNLQLSSIRIDVYPLSQALDSKTENENRIITSTLQSLPRTFLTDFQNTIAAKIISAANTGSIRGSYGVQFHWMPGYQ